MGPTEERGAGTNGHPADGERLGFGYHGAQGVAVMGPAMESLGMKHELAAG